MDMNEMNVITLVAQKKLDQTLLEEAKKAGATGITYFYGKGTGVRQKLGPLGASIEEDKVIYLIGAPPEKTTAILHALVIAGNVDRPGQGFAYVQKVSNVFGFLE